jgi:metal-responsive CopG/Arc/MetJ family transcriptional regulator
MTLELSIPDALAAAAHRAATERGMSRSELFARAVAAFLQSHDAVHTQASRPEEATDPVWTEGWESPPG